MHFDTEHPVAWPRGPVWEVVRDRPGRLGAYLRHVRDVEVVEREREGDAERIVRRWQMRADRLPSPLPGTIPERALVWLEDTTWRAASCSCDFTLYPAHYEEAIGATGQMALVAEGDDTIIAVRGELSIHPERLPRLPDLLRALGGPLEQVVGMSAGPFVRRLAESVQALLDDET